MAVKKSSKATGNAATSVGGATSVAPLFEIINKYKITSVSPKVEEFIKNVKELSKESNVDVEVLNSKNLFIHKNGQGVMVVFGETINKSVGALLENKTVKEVYSEIISNVFGDPSKVNILDMFIVTDKNIEESNKLFMFAKRIIDQHLDPQVAALNIESLKDVTIIIDTNMNNVKQFMNNFGYMPDARSDYGFVIYLFRGKVGFGNIQDPSILKDAIPILAVTGYTEYISQTGMTQDLGITGLAVEKFQPIIHISDIVSLFTNPNMIPLAIAFAIDVFIGRNFWRNPNNIKKIGALIIDPKTEKPWKPNNDMELVQFLNTYVMPPILVIDVIPGFNSIPMLAFINNKAELINTFSKFFNVQINEDITPGMFSEIFGFVKFKNEIKDVRYVDYLNVVEMFGYRPDFRLKFLTKADPTFKCKAIEELFEFDKYSVNYSFVINSNLVNYIRTKTAELNVITSFEHNIPIFDISQFAKYSFGATNMFYNPMAPMGGGQARGLF